MYSLLDITDQMSKMNVCDTSYTTGSASDVYVKIGSIITVPKSINNRVSMDNTLRQWKHPSSFKRAL